MNWHTTSGTAANKAALWTAIRGFFITCGWTLHDDLSAGSPEMYIYRSTGEDGKKNIFFRMYYSTNASIIGCDSCRYWDAASHTGYQRFGVTYSTSVSSGIATSASSHLYFFYGNKDAVHLVTKVGTSYRNTHISDTIPLLDSGTAVTQASASAGANVEITVGEGQGAYFTAGESYTILNCNHATGDIEVVAVTGVVGDVVTVATLASDHPTGAVFGRNPSPVVCSHTSASTPVSYTLAIGGSAYNGAVAPHNSYYAEADGVYGLRWLTPWIVLLGGWGNLTQMRYVYGTATTGITSEDTVTVGTAVYKYFATVASGYNLCILQSAGA